MRNLSYFLLIGFAAASLLMQRPAVAQSSEPVLSQVASNQAPDNANCRDYNALATIDGRPQPLVGRACRQPDGTWRISEDVLGNTSPSVVTYLPPPAGYPVYGDPLLWDFPIGFSIGVPFFIDQHRHFRGFTDFHRFVRNAGFGHEGHFDGGFHGGFGHR